MTKRKGIKENDEEKKEKNTRVGAGKKTQMELNQNQKLYKWSLTQRSRQKKNHETKARIIDK